MRLQGIRNERDRYWIGLILLLRRKINKMCESEGALSKVSVMLILDDTLPDEVVRLEKLEQKKDRRKKSCKKN